MHVVCTAGHVDHGKSTLIRALTGRDPDRLAEEKRRGLTIDLGFAWTDLGGGGAALGGGGDASPGGVGTVAFVDLPGHERFVPTMLAGAGGVASALFVVAADEGWMPQSEEHLAILELLQVRHAVVALTRCDLVDEETVEIAELLVADRLGTSTLSEAAVVRTSAVTGEGLEELRVALGQMLDAVPEAADVGRPRLWVDRAFTVAGAGTVVTGTLAGGQLRPGDDVVIQPGGRVGRIRGLQSLETDIDIAAPGWRVAVNVAGLDVADCPRGSALISPDAYPVTDQVEAWANVLPGATLRRRGAWRVHAGTASVPATLAPVAGGDLEEEGPVRIVLQSALPLAGGDRLVIRDAGRSATAAGAEIIDPQPPPKPSGRDGRAARVAALTTRQSRSAGGQRLVAMLADRGPTPLADACRAVGTAAADPVPDGVTLAGDVAMTDADWALLSELAVQAVTSVHQRRPALPAADPAVARKRLRDGDCPEAAVDAVLRHIVALGRLERVTGGLRLPGFEPRLTEAQQQARTALLAALEAAGVEPPPLAEVAARTGADEDLLTTLVADGQLVPIADGERAVTAAAFDRARRKVAALDQPFTASQAREALGTSRKHALPLLEAMDAAGVTRRDGDARTMT